MRELEEENEQNRGHFALLWQKNTPQGYECNRPKKLKVKECQPESVECLKALGWPPALRPAKGLESRDDVRELI